MLADCHMHTHFSMDSEAAPESMADAAVEKGLKTICFTDHIDKDFEQDGKEIVFDTVEYMHTMEALQKKFADKLQIRIGVELGLQPHLGAYYKEYTEKYPFDFVIGSVHVVDAKDPYFPEFFEGISDEQAYRRTLEATLENIKAVSSFDVLGHMDYVVRYGRHQAQEYSYKSFAPLIDEILRYLIADGKGIELNMAGIKYGLPFAHPHPDVLKRYKELGGEIITVGADGHKPEHVAYAYEKANAILEGCGFKYYTEFIARKPVFKKI